jgi:hypothetical protein
MGGLPHKKPTDGMADPDPCFDDLQSDPSSDGLRRTPMTFGPLANDPLDTEFELDCPLDLWSESCVSSIDPIPEISPQITSSPCAIVRRTDSIPRSRVKAPPQVRQRKPYSPKQCAILVAWLNEHSDHPYPTAAEVIMLANEAELSERQVRTFCVNFRMRKWKGDRKADGTK